MIFAENTTAEQGKQPYKYNGKELDQMHGLNLYDYSARYYEPAIGRFTTVDPLAEMYYSISPYAYCNNNPLRFIDPTGMAYSSSDPNQIGNMLDHLNNGGSVKNYDYGGWEETEDPEPPQDWPPFGYTNYHLVAAEQKRIEAARQIPEKLVKGVKKTGKTIITSALAQYLNGVVAIGVDISYETHAVVAVSAKIIGAILILKGADEGKIVILAEGGLGGGILAGVSITANGTQYLYDGSLDNLKVSAFTGTADNYSFSAGEGVVVNASMSYAKDGYGGRVFGYSLGAGWGVSATIVDVTYHKTFTVGRVINK